MIFSYYEISSKAEYSYFLTKKFGELTIKKETQFICRGLKWDLKKCNSFADTQNGWYI